MVWQGHSDNSIWFAQYSDQKGWRETAKLTIFETSAGPTLVRDGYLNIQLVWKDKSDNNMFWATLSAVETNEGPRIVWSPQYPGNGWSSQFKLPVIATGIQPSLFGDIPMLIFKGSTHDDLWVVPQPVRHMG